MLNIGSGPARYIIVPYLCDLRAPKPWSRLQSLRVCSLGMDLWATMAKVWRIVIFCIA